MRIRRLAGSQQLLDNVCGRFKNKKGGSLGKWCQANGITDRYARQCLTGERNGPKLEWRWQIVDASLEGDQHWQVLRLLLGLSDKWEKQIEAITSRNDLKSLRKKAKNLKVYRCLGPAK